MITGLSVVEFYPIAACVVLVSPAARFIVTPRERKAGSTLWGLWVHRACVFLICARTQACPYPCIWLSSWHAYPHHWQFQSWWGMKFSHNCLCFP